jgi:hypothetical protein
MSISKWFKKAKYILTSYRSKNVFFFFIIKYTNMSFEYNLIAITFINVLCSSGKWTLKKRNGNIYHNFLTINSLISGAFWLITWFIYMYSTRGWLITWFIYMYSTRGWLMFVVHCRIQNDITIMTNMNSQ